MVLKSKTEWIYLVLCVFLTGLSSPAFGGAWTQKQKGYYFKISTSYANANEDIDAMGNRIPKARLGELKDFNIAAYLEYGLTDNLTLVASMPYKRLTDYRTFVNGIAREKRSGFGDVEVRVRRLAFRKGSLLVSGALGGKIPTWYENDPLTRVPLSSRKLDVDGRILLGQSLYPFPGYWTAEGGFRVRGGVFSNEIFYALEGGVWVGQVLFKGYVAGIRSLGPCEVQEEVGLIGDQDVIKLSPGVIYRMKNWLELSLDMSYVAAGCNTTAGNTFSFGIALKR